MVRTTRPLLIALTASVLASCGAVGRTPAREAQAPAAAGPVNFVQELHRKAGSKTALSQGVLTLDPAGCLRLGPAGPALVWPADAALDLTRAGVVRVFDRRTGEAVRVGEAVALGGGSFPTDGPPTLNRPLGPCRGALLDVDSFEPLGAFHARDPHLADGSQAAS